MGEAQWDKGSIFVPRGARLAFLPQRPYVAPGTLVSARCYPHEPAASGDAALAAALKRVGLEHLVSSLDNDARWDKDLEPDIQQRLSFARLLLVKPDFVFLDEAFDILDEEHRDDIASIFDRELAHAAVVNFARHRAPNGNFRRTMRLLPTDTSNGADPSTEPADPSSPVEHDDVGMPSPAG